jgi:hypothetical protein
VGFDSRNLGGGVTLSGVANDPSGIDAVAKIGRTTAMTEGRITAFEVDNVQVDYDGGTATFDGQLEIESTGTGLFSDGGDSGSLIYTPEGLAVGLLFAGSSIGGSNGLGLTYANLLIDCLSTLDCELVI